MKLPAFMNAIWNITGRVALAPGQSSDDAFGKLDPLFQEVGTSHERTGDTLTFRKKDQAAQDRMAIFDGGVLRIEDTGEGAVLQYRLTSRTLLACFLAPLLFLAFAGLTIAVGKLEKASATTEEAKKPEKEPELRQHWIDAALGAPAPEKKKDDEPEDEGPSPTAAYVFAALFAALYVAGRLLEAWLAKALFRKRLAG